MTNDRECELTVRVTPKSSQNKMAIQADGSVRIWVNAPPVDGAANGAAVKLVSQVIGVSKSQIEIVRGEKGRDKTFRISGLLLGEVMERIPKELP
ncbi:MAG: DUF167 domain-containing protein [Fimbriimonadaceae bacterium]